MQSLTQPRNILRILSLILLMWGLGVNNPAIAQDFSARDTFEAAYQNRYVWDQQFPGITADVVLSKDGNTYGGKAQISPDLTATVFDVTDLNVATLIQGQLQMEIIHRRPIPFEVLHGEDQFQFEGIDDTGRMTIREIDPESDSFYQVQDKILYQVNRTLGAFAVTVDTLETCQTDQGYLVSQFAVTFRDGETNSLLEQEEVQDYHTQVGAYYLLSDRIFQVDGDEIFRLQLQNIELMS